MSIYLFGILCYYLLCLSQQTIEGGKITKDFDDQPILYDFTGGQLEEALDEATKDEEEKKEQSIERIDGQIKEEVRGTSRGDAHVPSSLSNSLFHSDEIDDLQDLLNSLSISTDEDLSKKSIVLNRVANGEIPPGIDVHPYTDEEKNTLIRLYESDRLEDRHSLFQFIVEHTHNKLFNCARNFGQWMRNPRFDEPIFYRNCVPCTNTVDLNLQSLFDSHLQLDKLNHYFVNTCQMGKKWISYAADMEQISIDLKRHPTATFTDVIRQNLLPNYRYVFQGLVRSEFVTNHREFFHVCNLIHDESGHIWIIDGQIERVFDFDQPNDIKQLDQRYRPDYITRASTGLFRPPTLIEQSVKQ